MRCCIGIVGIKRVVVLIVGKIEAYLDVCLLGIGNTCYHKQRGLICEGDVLSSYERSIRIRSCSVGIGTGFEYAAKVSAGQLDRYGSSFT